MLIMDMPSSCGNCDISSKVKSQYQVRCLILKKLVCKFENCIPNDCPLREVPQYKHLDVDGISEFYANIGFNQCIRKILGGGE